MTPFGTILEDRFVETEGIRTGAYHFQLQLHEGSRVPNIIYLDGEAIGVTNKSARKQCTWCHNYGHLQRQCQKKRMNWVSQLERQALREVDGMDWAATNHEDTQRTGIDLSLSQSQRSQSTGINLTDGASQQQTGSGMPPPPVPPKSRQQTSPENTTEPTDPTNTPSTSHSVENQHPKDTNVPLQRLRNFSDISDISDVSQTQKNASKGRQRSASQMTISTSDESGDEEEQQTTPKSSEQLREEKFCNKTPQVVPSCDPATLDITPISDDDYIKTSQLLEKAKQEEDTPEGISRSMIRKVGREQWEDYRTEYAYRNKDPTDEEFQFFEEVYNEQYPIAKTEVDKAYHFKMDTTYNQALSSKLNEILKDIFGRRLGALCRRKWPPKDDT